MNYDLITKDEIFKQYDIVTVSDMQYIFELLGDFSVWLYKKRGCNPSAQTDVFFDRLAFAAVLMRAAFIIGVRTERKKTRLKVIGGAM